MPVISRHRGNRQNRLLLIFHPMYIVAERQMEEHNTHDCKDILMPSNMKMMLINLWRIGVLQCA